MRTVGILSVLLLISGPSFSQVSQQTEREVAAMSWADASGFRLPTSNSFVVNLPGFRIVSGAQARRLREIVDGRSDPQEEADAFNVSDNSELIYEWFPVGFVSSDDWKDVDPNKFMDEMRRDDGVANQIRAKKGLPTLTTTGWCQEPELNKDLHTVSWCIKAVNSRGENVVNDVALKMGRYGFEKIIWVIDPKEIGRRNDLWLAINNHEFSKGAHYTDYVAGTDRAAEYGVAGLVAGVLGVKLLKAAGIGAALLGLKKFAIVLVLPFVYGWRKLKGFFKRSGGAGA